MIQKHMQSRTRVLSDYAVILVFGIVTAAILFKTVLPADIEPQLNEKRQLRKMPDFRLTRICTFPDDFEGYFKDNFGFRNIFIRGHNWIQYRIFKSEIGGKVFTANDGWLFYARHDMIQDFLGHAALSRAELDLWKGRLDKRRRLLDSHNIKYLFVIAPNKISIYPEKLPYHIYINGRRTRMDQFMDYLQNTGFENILDMRKAMLEAKGSGLLYYPTDSHWNYRGGLVAYRQICAEISSRWTGDMNPLSKEDFVVDKEMFTGNLAEMMGLEGEFRIKADKFTLIKHRDARKMNSSGYSLPFEVRGGINIFDNPERKQSLLVVHDSFCLYGNIMTNLAEHFKRSVFIGDIHLATSDLETVIEKERPDIVLEITAEYRLGKLN